MKKWVFCFLWLLFVVLGHGVTLTLRSLVVTNSLTVELQDIFVGSLPASVKGQLSQGVYTTKDVGNILLKKGFADFVLVGDKVEVYTAVSLTTPEKLYEELGRKYPGKFFAVVELPESFHVVGEVWSDNTLEISYRVYRSDSVAKGRVRIPCVLSSDSVQEKENVPLYVFETVHDRDGFLTYRKNNISIRLPVKV